MLFECCLGIVGVGLFRGLSRSSGSVLESVFCGFFFIDRTMAISKRSLNFSILLAAKSLSVCALYFALLMFLIAFFCIFVISLLHCVLYHIVNPYSRCDCPIAEYSSFFYFACEFVFRC